MSQTLVVHPLTQPATDARKARAATAYLVRRTHAAPAVIMALRYLADRQHLMLYGSFIAHDTYLAGPEGPQPAPCACPQIGPLDVQTLLSLSDFDCLNAMVAQWEHLGSDAICHQAKDAAWGCARLNASLLDRPIIALEAIVAQVDEDGTLAAHLRHRHPGEAVPA